MLPKKDEDAANLVAGSVFTSLIISILLFLLFLLFNVQIIALLSLPEIMRFWLLILPLSIFLFSSSQVFNYWLIRKKAFKSSSLNKVYRRGAEGVSQVGLGVTFFGSGLVVGNIVGDLTNFISSYYQAVKSGFHLKALKKLKIIALFKRYSSFPKYNALPALLDTISLSIPVILLNKFYGGEVTGYFDLSRMFMALPLALISVSISQVLFQDISVRIRDKKTIEDVLKRIIKILAVAAGLIVLIGMLFSVPLFTLVFGEKWELSGVMTTILIPAYGLRFLVTPLTITFNALEKIFWISLWQLVYFIMICSLFFLDGISVTEFLYVYLTIDVIAYVIYFLLLRWQVRNYEKNRILNA
jgi:O-antigen/teichoic acid export membrane protein